MRTAAPRRWCSAAVAALAIVVSSPGCSPPLDGTLEDFHARAERLGGNLLVPADWDRDGGGQPWVVPANSARPDRVPWMSVSALAGDAHDITSTSASVVVTITLHGEPRAQTDFQEGAHPSRRYEIEGLRVGERLTHGPVTIELVATYAAEDPDDSIAAFRVAFDEGRLDQVP